MTRAARSRRWTIAAAVALFAAIFVLRLLDDAPADGVGFLYVLPIGLVAVELGWRWGLAASPRCASGEGRTISCSRSCATSS